ncbi:hypothetical protein [Variovorax paradoxus]|uniref:hypothetical protein n=1 Tax=Variovorax paradoxus TaxID=34073 RepID=UPI001ABC34D9
MSETLMPHPDGSGRLVPHSIWVTLKPQYEARRSAFDGNFGKYLSTEQGRATAVSAFMQSDPVDRVEVAPLAGKFVDPSLSESRVDARINGELNGTVNNTGAIEFEVPVSNLYRDPSSSASPHYRDLKIVRVNGYSGLPIED